MALLKPTGRELGIPAKKRSMVSTGMLFLVISGHQQKIVGGAPSGHETNEETTSSISEGTPPQAAKPSKKVAKFVSYSFLRSNPRLLYDIFSKLYIPYLLISHAIAGRESANFLVRR